MQQLIRSFLIVLLCGAAVQPAAADPDLPRVSNAAPNAAVIYWQAFAVMPALNDAQKQLLDAASTTGPIDEDLPPILVRYRVALHELQRARRVRSCDWQLDLAAGPHLQLPQLQKARELSRIALLRARHRSAVGDQDGALADVLAVFKLGRDCGTSAVLIGYLVDVAIEKSATDVLAMILPRLNVEQQESAEEALRALPPPQALSTLIDVEEQCFGHWLEGEINRELASVTDPRRGGESLLAVCRTAGLNDVVGDRPNDLEAQRRIDMLKSLTAADVRGAVGRLRADYRLLKSVAALPPSDRMSHLEEFERELADARKLATRDDAQRLLSCLLLPSLKNVILRADQFRVRGELLFNAIRVQQSGADALRPIDGQPINYQSSAGGFTLRFDGISPSETLVIGAVPSAPQK